MSKVSNSSVIIDFGSQKNSKAGNGATVIGGNQSRIIATETGVSGQPTESQTFGASETYQKPNQNVYHSDENLNSLQNHVNDQANNQNARTLGQTHIGQNHNQTKTQDSFQASTQNQTQGNFQQGYSQVVEIKASGQKNSQNAIINNPKGESRLSTERKFVLVGSPQTKKDPKNQVSIQSTSTSKVILDSREEMQKQFEAFSQSLNQIIYTFIGLCNYLFAQSFYVLYNTVVTIYTGLKDSPDFVFKKYQDLLDFADYVGKQDSRRLFILELKLEAKILYTKLERFFSSSILLLQKSYLFLIVIFCLIFLNFSSVISFANPNKQTLMENILENHTVRSVSDKSKANKNQEAVFSTVSSGVADVDKISSYTVKEKDTLEKIAELYSVSPETIIINNKLNKENPTLDPGKELYIPWQDGYIYAVTKEVDTDKISAFYEISKEDLVRINKKAYNKDTNKFQNGALLLIPSTNFDKIRDYSEEEEVRKENLKKAEEQRQAMLKSAAVRSEETITGAGEKNPYKFVWPTTGYISRCVQPGHIACDIANSSNPPIYSVQSGTVVKSGWRDGGYGNMALIDHGNGVQTMYMHMSEVSVAPGDVVNQGDKIGTMGCTGNCSGTHLHFEVWVGGDRKNPLAYLP